MDKKAYIHIKDYLNNYNFNKQINFTKLYQDFKNFDNPMPFKRFVTYCKALGVASVVRRQPDQSLLRYLEYDRKNDTLVTVIFDEFITCPTCKGKGMVKK